MAANHPVWGFNGDGLVTQVVIEYNKAHNEQTQEEVFGRCLVSNLRKSWGWPSSSQRFWPQGALPLLRRPRLGRTSKRGRSGLLWGMGPGQCALIS
jgi:hypothetical protein